MMWLIFNNLGYISRTIQGRRRDAELNLSEGEVLLSYDDVKNAVGGEFDLSSITLSDGRIIINEPNESEYFGAQMALLRQSRDAMLLASDWTQVPDAPVDQAAWAVYRQQLRDLPDNTQDPRDPVWPTPPA